MTDDDHAPAQTLSPRPPDRLAVGQNPTGRIGAGAERELVRPGTLRAPLRVFPVFATILVLCLAGVLAWAMWQAYMAAPWTRDASVRAYVVTLAPEVSGRIIALPIADNQAVHKGDILAVIDPADYTLALAQANAAVTQARATAQDAQQEAERRAQLNNLESSVEERQHYAALAAAADATYQGAVASVARAQLNLQRTQIRSPVNGYVTHLLAQVGDYATTGASLLTLVNADSFWVDGYFEETSLADIQPGDPASIRLMGYKQLLQGHVDSIARGIAVANAAPGASGLAQVNPIFTWVRLAQRVPVRIAIDHVPPGVRLVAGQTASVEIGSKPQ